MLHGERAFAGPSYVVLDLTRRCNTVCVGCWYHCVQERVPTPGDHAVRDLSVALLERLAAELGGMGTSEIFLLGEGEPLLHPGFFDVVAAFKRAGMTVRCFTNGTLLTEDVCRRLVASGLDTLLLSVWAVTPEEHEKNHPGITLAHLRKRRDAVRFLGAAKRAAASRAPTLRLQFVMNRHNCANVAGRVDFALASGCDEVGFGIFRDYGGMFEGLAVGADDRPALESALATARAAFAAHGIRHDIPQYLERLATGPETWTRLPCYAGWYASQIKVDGTVLPCAHCATPMGNLQETSFAEIWNGPAYRAFRRAGMRRPEEDRLAHCDCVNCCQVTDNLRVGRLFAPVRPWVAGRHAGGAPEVATPARSSAPRPCGK
jgi:MoaA/NifB/PqqE/SkfB family radical SAM enzyme